MSEFRKEFVQALELLARAFERVVQAGWLSPANLFQLAPAMDEDYLNRRIVAETSGVYDLAFLRAKIEERT